MVNNFAAPSFVNIQLFQDDDQSQADHAFALQLALLIRILRWITINAITESRLICKNHSARAQGNEALNLR